MAQYILNCIVHLSYAFWMVRLDTLPVLRRMQGEQSVHKLHVLLAFTVSLIAAVSLSDHFNIHYAFRQLRQVVL